MNGLNANGNAPVQDEKDYARLIAAQNEHARRLKIKEIQNTLTDEHKWKVRGAVATGISVIGVLAATYFSGFDVQKAIDTEISALNYFSALKEYLSMITPAMWGTIALYVSSATGYLKHKRNYDKANRDFYDAVATSPEDYQGLVESQARSK